MKKIVMVMVACLGMVELSVIAAPREGHDRSTVSCRRRFRRGDCPPCVAGRAFPVVTGNVLDCDDTCEDICLLKLEVCRLSRQVRMLETLVSRCLAREKGMRQGMLRGNGDREHEGDNFDMPDEEFFDTGSSQDVSKSKPRSEPRSESEDESEDEESNESEFDSSVESNDFLVRHDYNARADTLDAHESSTTEVFDYEIDIEDFDTLFE